MGMSSKGSKFFAAPRYTIRNPTAIISNSCQPVTVVCLFSPVASSITVVSLSILSLKKAYMPVVWAIFFRKFPREMWGRSLLLWIIASGFLNEGPPSWAAPIACALGLKAAFAMEKTNAPQTINRHTFVIKTGSFLLNTLLAPLNLSQYNKLGN